MQVFRRPQVFEDLVDAAEFIAQDNPDAAERFLEAFELTLTKLQATPEIGVVRKFAHPKLQSIRMWFIQGFPHHLIFYRLEVERLEIIRVLHSAQDYTKIFKD